MTVAGAPTENPSLIAVALRAEATAISGAVRIHAPPEWLSVGRAPARPRSRELRAVAVHLRTVASVELAVTTLRFRELAGARSGDAVVFDGTAWPGQTERSVELRIGDHVAPARTSAAGQAGALVVLAGRFQAAERRARATSNPRATRARPAVVEKTGAMTDDGDKSTDGGANADLLASAPIEIVAELGRIVLRGDEVLGLEEGSVLSLGRPSTTVDLVVGGRTWARGELVNVDGELGVRIIELAPR